MSVILSLIRDLTKEKNIFIQTHNFPDHDAIASAYGLQVLLQKFNISSTIIYKGSIQRDSLNIMINNLGIKAYSCAKLKLSDCNKNIIVDGCACNKNVDDLIGDEICVIDHHEIKKPESIKLTDIRPSAGSCSTIIYSYFKELNIEIERTAASALLCGLNMDTLQMTRGVSKLDVEAFADLYMKADIPLVNTILRNYIQTKDLSFYKYLLENIIIKDKFAFCYYDNGCCQNLLGILSDFLLALEEVDFTVLCAKNENVINLSVRSENKALNASTIIQKVLKNIGFGGGHSDMAGGIIKDISKFNKKEIFDTFYNYINASFNAL